MDAIGTLDPECLRLYPTKDLVEELKTRDSVEVTIIGPYEKKELAIEGVATVLIVTD